MPPSANDLTPLSPSDWNYDFAAHLIERAGFGGTPEEIQALAALTPSDAVRKLVYFQNIENNLPPSMTKGKKKTMKPVPADIFKGRYQNHAAPKFFAEVKPENNEVPPFELND